MRTLTLLAGRGTAALCICAGAQSLAAVTTNTEIYATRGERQLEVHLHFPDGWSAEDRRPAIIFFFGGGWANGSPDQFLPQAEYFASRGLVTARADYRVKSRDGVTPDECVRDARTAVRWMKTNAARLGLDPAKLVASGGSAGGHLAACMLIEDCVEAPDDDLTVSPMPVAMLLFNPVMTFEHEQISRRLGDKQDLAPKISPTAHLAADTPPSLILFGSNDRLKALADGYWEKAEDLGVRSEAFIAEGQGHGFFNREPWRTRSLIASDRFLSSLGLLTGEPTLAEPPPDDAPAAGAPTGRRRQQARRWKQLDRDGDGRIDRDEAKGPLERHFDRIDANADGHLDEDEITAAVERRRRP